MILRSNQPENLCNYLINKKTNILHTKTNNSDCINRHTLIK